MPDPAAPEANNPNPNPAGGGDGNAPPARPDWAPEKFWDAEKGELRAQDLAKSYAEGQKLIGRKAEEAKAAARAEVEKDLFGNRPEKPEAYEFGVPEDVQDVVVMVGKPADDFAPEEGKTYLSLNPDSKALGMLRTFMHRAGASPAEFNALLAEVARENGQRVPTAADREAEAHKVYEALGEHGQRRVQHTWGQMVSLLGKERAGALDALAGDAKAVEALEELVARASGTRFAPPAGGSGVGGRLTEEELRAKMRDPRYADASKRDPAFVAEVTAGWKTLYPD